MIKYTCIPEIKATSVKISFLIYWWIYLGIGAQTYNSNTWGVRMEDQGVEGLPQLHSEFEVTQDLVSKKWQNIKIINVKLSLK